MEPGGPRKSHHRTEFMWRVLLRGKRVGRKEAQGSLRRRKATGREGEKEKERESGWGPRREEERESRQAPRRRKGRKAELHLLKGSSAHAYRDCAAMSA